MPTVDMKPFTLLPTLACLILIVAHCARGFSSGAPKESCDSLLVNHTHVGSPSPGAECGPPCLTALCFDPCLQFRQLRLTSNSSADSFTYNCNETYQLQLTTTDPADMSLNGYMVAPREDTGAPLDGDVPYVGSWESGIDMKLLCNESAVTQSKALRDTTTVNMTWKAPMYGLTNVAFWFVIVPSTAFYYLPVKSLTATPNPEACSCPPGQCQWLNGTEFSCVEPDNALCGPGEVFNDTECQCEDCSLSIICMDGGVLNISNCMCDCPATYNGSRCENCIRECQNNGTLNNSTCSCTCAAGYSGPDCGTCIRMCQNEGTLDEGLCMCDCVGGFSGDNCEVRPRAPSSVVPVVVGILGGVIFVCIIIAVLIVLVCICRGKRAKFDANDSDNVQLKGLTSQNVNTQYLNPQLSTSEDVQLEQNPAYTDTELHKPTTDPLGKEDAAGETSDDVKYENA